MKKSILSILLIASALSLSVSQAFASFSDVNQSDNLFYDAITYVQQQGIVGGYVDGTYRPNNPINRAEFTKILISAVYSQNEMDNCLANYKNKLIFSDADTHQWFSSYLCLAKEKNIISGYSDGSFKPGQNIAFSEAAKIIAKAYGLPTQSDPVWYKPYIVALDTKRAIPGTIQSAAYNITRGEMAEIIYRLKLQNSGKFSLTYDQVAGSQSSCKKVGQTTSGALGPQYRSSGCCTGEVSYWPSYQKGQLLVGGGAICLEPQIGLQQAADIFSTSNSCTSSPDVGQTRGLIFPYRNQNFNGFSFPMTSYKNGCAVRCDVNLDNNQANIGWMCTGLITK